MSANMSAKPSDVLCNHAKEKLARGEVVASMTVRLVRGIEIARIAKTAGFDSLYVDMEHSSFSLETMSQICIAALEVGITPFVRVPGLADVQRILDGGALGIIAPHVQTATEARDYVKAGEVKLLNVEGLDLWRELGLIYRRDRSLPRAALALIGMIREMRKTAEPSIAAAS